MTKLREVCAGAKMDVMSALGPACYTIVR